ncbi:uncharacterized protein LOC131269477 [Anopheles coustani]|uniref:uncharacterized protein LOC131269477 n=2 Tax=coustani group TaxID=59130 RepID=UPI002657C3BC|nr:uncharacterized protein LOC131269477 [Anopheles coustani]
MIFSSLLKTPARKSSIRQIILSRRMLSEHVESFEQCLADLGGLEYCSFEKSFPFHPGWVGCVGCVFPSATIGFSKSYPTVASTLGTVSVAGICLYAYLRYELKQQQNILTDLLVAFEKFDDGIKRNRVFIKQLATASENMTHSSAFKEDTAVNCLRTCKDAIELIFNCDMNLAKRMDPRYSNMIEPLAPIEVADDANDVLKIIHYAFLYAQSHFLLCLGLVQLSDKTAINIRNLFQLKHSLAECNERLWRFVRMVDQAKLNAKVPLHEEKPIPQELVMLRNQSLEIAMKLAATTNDVLALDDELQGKDVTTDHTVLERMMTHLLVVRDNLLLRADESERLVICMQRLLCKENFSDQAAGESQNDTEGGAVAIDNMVILDNTLSGEAVNESADEFFFLVGIEDKEIVAAKPSAQDLDAAEDLVSRRKIKRQFQPVLKELREQLQPIGLSFHQRCKAALKLKGIEGDQFTPYGSSSPIDSLSVSPSDEDDDDKPEPTQNTQNRYDELRSYLANKQQFLLIGNPPTDACCQQEDIIE